MHNDDTIGEKKRTSSHDISIAAGSPGEHGVRKSSATFLKCVAVCTFRTGCMRASRTHTAMSDPEYLQPTSAHVKARRTAHTAPLPVRHPCQLSELLLRDRVRRIAQVQLENACTRSRLRQRDVDTLLKSVTRK